MAGLGAAIPLLGNSEGTSVAGGGGTPEVIEVSQTENLTITPTDANAVRPGAIVTEVIAFQQNTMVKGRYGLALMDAQRLTDALSATLPLTAMDSLTLADAATVVQGSMVIDALRITGTPTAATTYARSIADRLWASDIARSFFGGELLDSVATTDMLAVTPRLQGVLEDAVNVSGVLGHSLVLRVIAADTIEVTPAQALQMFYAPTLVDVFELSAAYLSPGGSLTTWVANARTGAVTEYSNYGFNSFAQIGGRYIATSDTGLYELTGDSDDGADIVARIRSGFQQFSGTHLGQFKSAYLGVTGGGDYILKVILTSGAEYDYAVKAEDGRHTKINVGKGLRARYFAFELISAGQDFDLDLVEFVPIIAQRRV